MIFASAPDSRASTILQPTINPAADITDGSPHELIVAQLTEHNLGPEDLSPTPAPLGSPVQSPAAGASASSAPTAGTIASPAVASTPMPTPQAGESPSSSSDDQSGSQSDSDNDSDSDSGVSMTPAGVATAPVALPPFDYASVPPSMPVSDSSLDPIIKKTTDSARVASLRITEEARRLLAAGHPDEAIRALGRAISIDASNPYAYFYLGRSYFVRKEYDQALTFLARAEIGIGSDPAWLGETLSFEGACYEELGRDREAADAYQHALQVAPGNLMARVGFGRLASYLPQPTPTAESPSDIGALDEPPPAEATPAPASQAPIDQPNAEPSRSASPDDSTDDSNDNSSDN